MKNTYLVVLAAAFALAGCTSSPDSADLAREQIKAESIVNGAAQKQAEAKISTVPEWFLMPPKNDSTGVYGVGTGESRKLDLAMKKACLNAQYELAKTFSQVLSGNAQSYLREGNSGIREQYTQLIDSLVTSVPVHGYQTVQQEVVATGGKFTAYKLLRLTYEQFGQSLEKLNSGSAQEEIKAAFTELQQRQNQKFTGHEH